MDGCGVVARCLRVQPDGRARSFLLGTRRQHRELFAHDVERR